MSWRFTEGQSSMAVCGGPRAGSERTASSRSVKQMVAVPRRWGQRALWLDEPAGRFLKQSLSQSQWAACLCVCVCCGGCFSVGGCQSLPIKDEGMYRKNVWPMRDVLFLARASRVQHWIFHILVGLNLRLTLAHITQNKITFQLRSSFNINSMYVYLVI